MASVAQIQANRSNAQKSTGPRTAAGKERASQNAIKHGLLAREAVIQGEDAEEFECYREGMLRELAPAGAVEAMLAERVVGLSWRLRRAERLQNAAFAALDEDEPTDLLDARHEEWKQLKGSEWDRGVSGLFDENAALGKVVVEDFAGARALDRLLMYERRIESSLYRTMGELRRERQARAAAAEPKEVSRSEGDLAAGQELAAPVELGSFGTDAAPEGGNHGQNAHATGTGHGGQSHGRDAHATGTPCGVATNDEGRATPSPAETLHDHACETNPISGGSSCCEGPDRGGVRIRHDPGDDTASRSGDHRRPDHSTHEKMSPIRP